MQLKLIGLLTMLILTSQAQARVFYQSYFNIDITYSHIDTGATKLVTEQPILVKYSDDHEFCQILVDVHRFPCDSFHQTNSPESTAITLDRQVVADLLANVLEGHLPEQRRSERKCKCRKHSNCRKPRHGGGVDYLAKFQRLSSYLLDPIDLEIDRNFSQQLHDEEPESFQVKLYDLTVGEEY